MKIHIAWRIAMNMLEVILFGILRNFLKALAWPFNKAAEKLNNRMNTLISQAKEKMNG